MGALVFGLLLFLGTHSLRIVAEDWRARQLARLGPRRWQGLFALVAALGFVLLVWGYGQTRLDGVALWQPPLWTRHLAALLMLPALILVAAAYGPANRIRAALGHPMLAGVKLWAFAHLLANGRLGDVLLFGAFLLWAVLDFRAARQRDRRAGVMPAAGSVAATVLAVAAGAGVWLAFASFLHRWLIGVPVFG
ncbi:putative membrane protein [Plasticicumulans lactativorans]|uniref:Putative membrane protein n=1 Tax=Plasticicumulans lactativorans TaxID=1133106 RepID=A0A4R2L5V6_9GAMM|nr:NnrU family protein [Plasticicumulans lactativorans]TCO81225.1 putative membrane protein [Plasticicumulans lactativorans]